MRDVELPELVDDNLIVTAERKATEQGSAKHHEWAAREDNSGEASSLSAQRESRPVDEDGNAVLSQAEIDEADEADEGAEPESDADALDAQAPKRGI